MKIKLTPENAIDSFVNCKKSNTEIPAEVIQTIMGFKKWHESALRGIINVSGYFPDILLNETMEQDIYTILSDFKKREIPVKF